MSPALRATLVASVSVALLGLGGCHSAFISATVRNATSETISPFEVDYPSASFGRTTLDAGATFPYRFKVLGSGATKVLWTDAHHIDHTVTGAVLKEGDEGTLQVTITGQGADLIFTAKPKP